MCWLHATYRDTPSQAIDGNGSHRKNVVIERDCSFPNNNAIKGVNCVSKAYRWDIKFRVVAKPVFSHKAGFVYI
jgi:hypothetical protein